ncbi:MAG: PIN domain-containing protein [Eggerthellaceae bacterium]|jgi:predicted nucleic acid-binding protein|nr:PIN domain-containing protein [Eggerthellaceae bacterium]
MKTSLVQLPSFPQVVLADANVLYARIIRDYLLHAASVGIISIAWSETILNEAIKHLIENIPKFSAESGVLLKRLMNEAYPLAQVDSTQEDFLRLDAVCLPDENDRHVLAAALAAEANVLCTANTKDFPKEVTSLFDLSVFTPDELLSALIVQYPEKMLIVHSRTVSRLQGATDASTLEALIKAGASVTSRAMGDLLKQNNS